MLNFIREIDSIKLFDKSCLSSKSKNVEINADESYNHAHVLLKNKWRDTQTINS